MQTITKETYELINNVPVLISTENVEVPTQEEVIAEKEAELLAMYNEIQALKNKTDI